MEEACRAASALVLFLAFTSVSPAIFPDPYSRVLISPALAAPVDYDVSYDTQLLDAFSTSTQKPKLPKPNILMFHAESEISNRYARTLVKSRVANPANVSQEVVFSIIIPDTAFITSFAMEIEGKIYKAYVKEKEEAQRVYHEAVNRGQTAAHVSARDADRFSVAVNIEAQSKVSFNLTYEELLQLTHGLYRHAININPGQIVADMTIDVHIVEQKEIISLKVNDVQSANEIDNEVSENPKAQVEWINTNETKIHFKADEEEQRRLEKKTKPKSPAKDSSEGVAGKFVIEYNVKRDPSGGEVIVNDGYFVHFFAPHELPQLTKHVLFVLDVSGSMSGRKIEQLKEAMTAILDELNPKDFFNIIEFSYSVTVRNLDAEVNSAVYQPFASFPHSIYQEDLVTGVENNAENTRPFPATDEYKRKAKRIIEKMTAGGGTNINDALKTAVEIAKRGVSIDCSNSTENENKTCNPSENKAEDLQNANPPQPIIIFLTDGEPTVGETRLHKIQSAINEINSAPKSPIFSLAFGQGADFKFLKGLSLANNGFGRQIYEAADAQKQLNNFYRQLASPLLANVTFKYPPEVEDETLTKHIFSNLFRGSELVIAGKVTGDLRAIEIEAQSSMGPTKYDILPVPKATDKKYGALERLWAYLTIQQLLEEQEILEATTSQYRVYPDPAEDVKEKEASKNKTVQPKEKALEIALKYSFVCPLTSLVVVKPNGTDKLNTESAAPTENDGPSFLPQSAGYAQFPHFFSALNIAAPQAPFRLSYAAMQSGSGIFPPGLQQPYPYSGVSSMGYFPPAAQAPVDQPVDAFLFDSVESSVVDSSQIQANRLSFVPERSTFAPSFDRVDEEVSTESSNSHWVENLLKADTLIVSIKPNESKVLKVHAPTDIEYTSCSTNNGTGTCYPLSMIASCNTEIDELETYKQHYWCELQGQDSYAGVCCNQTENATTTTNGVDKSESPFPTTEELTVTTEELTVTTEELTVTTEEPRATTEPAETDTVEADSTTLPNLSNTEEPTEEIMVPASSDATESESTETHTKSDDTESSSDVEGKEGNK